MKLIYWKNCGIKIEINENNWKWECDLEACDHVDGIKGTLFISLWFIESGILTWIFNFSFCLTDVVVVVNMINEVAIFIDVAVEIVHLVKQILLNMKYSSLSCYNWSRNNAHAYQHTVHPRSRWILLDTAHKCMSPRCSYSDHQNTWTRL